MIRLRQRVGLLIFLGLLAIHQAAAQDGGRTPQTDPHAPASSSPPSPASSQNSMDPKQLLRDVWADQKTCWSSPFRMNRRQIFTVALPLTAATAGLIATDERAAKWLPNTPDQIRWSKRISTWGSVYTLGGLMAGSLIVGRVKDKPRVFQTGRISAEALLDAVIVGYAIKGMTARERPIDNSGQGRFWKGGDSFPSGHAIDNWAVAVAVGRSRGCPKWLAITSYGVATAVSLSRWGAYKHFPSDILVGSVFGGLIGNYVATRPR